MATEEEEGLLATGASGGEKSRGDNGSSLVWSGRPWMKIYLVFSHCIFLLAILGLVFTREGKQCQSDDVEDLYSPARSAIHHIIDPNYEVNRSMHSNYLGEPSESVDKAWRDLVDPTYLSLTDDEMQLAERTTSDSIRLDGGGYLGVLAVYHQLHCLRRLRRFIYHETYYPDYIAGNGSEYMQGHMGHCVEILRMAIMCHGDVSLYTYTWADDYPNARHNVMFRSKKERKCVDWSSLEEWSRTRAGNWSPGLIDPNGDVVFANKDDQNL